MASPLYGTAFLAIQPDLKGFVSSLARGLDRSALGKTAFMAIEPDLKGFGSSLTRGLDQSALGKTAGLVIEPDLKGFDSSLTRGLDRGGLLGSLGKTAGLAFGGALVAGAAGAVVGIGAALTEAISQEASGDKMAARLGLTEGDSARLGDIAGAAFTSNFGESMAGNQSAVENVWRAFGDLGNSALQEVTEGALGVADVFDQDVGEVIRAAQQLLVNGLAPDAQAALDIVSTALRDTQGPADEALSAISEYASQFAVVGLTGGQFLSGLTSEFATNQFAIDKLGDSVKELGIRLLDGSTLTKEALGSLGLGAEEVEAAYAAGGETASEMTRRIISGITDIEDPAERARLGVALMGTPFEDLGANAVPILKDLLVNMQDFGGVTEDITNQAAGNLAGTFSGAWRTIKQTVVDAVGDTIMPLLADAAKWFADRLPAAIETVKRVFESIGPVISNVFGAVSDFFGGIGAAVSSGGVQSAFGSLVSFFETMVGNIQTVVSTVLPIIRDVFGGIVTAFQNNREKIMGIVTTIGGIFEGLGDIIRTIFGAIKTFWAEWGDEITALIGNAIDTVVGIFGGIVTVIEGVIDIIAGIFTGDWKRVWEGISGVVGGVWETIKSIVEGAIGQVMVFFGGFIEDMTTTVSDGIDDVVTFFRELPGDILNFLKDLPGDMLKFGQDLVGGILDGLGGLASMLFEKIKDGVLGALGKLGEFFGIGSPSKMFRDEIGIPLGEGVLAGAKKSLDQLGRLMSDSIDAAQSDLIRRMEPIEIAVAGGDDINAIANVRRSMSRVDFDEPGRGGDLHFDVDINNPTGEPSEESVQAALLEVAISPIVNRLVSAGSSQ